MNPKFYILGEYWPDTGRTYPADAKLEIRHVHSKWRDLCWWNEKRDAFVYISTLPALHFLKPEFNHETIPIS